MDEKNTVSAEELEQERTALAEAKAEEVKEAVIAEYGFDEVDDAEKIEKLVQKELSHKKTLSEAIGQKINWRKRATEKPAESPKAPEERPKVPEVNIDEKLNEAFEKRDLEALEYPDDLKVEIQKIAKVQGVSVKKAAQDPYIAFKKAEYDKVQRVDEASISRTHKSGGKVTYSEDRPPEVDMATEEGRKKWDEYTVWLKTQPGYRPEDAAGM